MPDDIHYCCNDEMRDRPFDPNEKIAVSALLFVPRKEQYKEIGVAEGHYVTTSQPDLFNWIGKQLRVTKNPNVTGCSHLKEDISKVCSINRVLFSLS